MAPGPKTIHKLLRLILWITIGALFIAGGCAACALLWKETDTTKAVLLAVAALIGAAGCAQAFALLIERVAAIATEGRLAPTVEEAADLVWASANAASLLHVTAQRRRRLLRSLSKSVRTPCGPS